MQKFTISWVCLLPGRKRNEQGIALIGVLWLVVILAALAGGVAMLARDDRSIAKAEVDDLRAQGWADGGVYLTLTDLCDPTTSKDVPLNGEPRLIKVAGHDVRVTVQDEAGKIDLNYASQNVLASMLTAAGSVDGDGIAEAIIQTRSKRPFPSLGDLRFVTGITPALFQRVQPWVTLYAQRSAVNTSVAPQEVLAVLPGMDAGTMADIAASRNERSRLRGEAQRQQTPGSDILTITADAQTGNVVFQRRAVVQVTGNARQPYKIYEWAAGTTGDR